ncbi:hypothetical protein XELAEV_18036226mg [Xenopus laevis]|uniref:Uncharacterized protein n=1 Tax=Xenopus laevis TaxID=8355 RepID=A0A974HDA3_XENLA|nr:hypothetical protein XELAEV_18036226mg [Xenopus laevis]
MKSIELLHCFVNGGANFVVESELRSCSNPIIQGVSENCQGCIFTFVPPWLFFPLSFLLFVCCFILLSPVAHLSCDNLSRAPVLYRIMYQKPTTDEKRGQTEKKTNKKTAKKIKIKFMFSYLVVLCFIGYPHIRVDVPSLVLCFAGLGGIQPPLPTPLTTL